MDILSGLLGPFVSYKENEVLCIWCIALSCWLKFFLKYVTELNQNIHSKNISFEQIHEIQFLPAYVTFRMFIIKSFMV